MNTNTDMGTDMDTKQTSADRTTNSSDWHDESNRIIIFDTTLRDGEQSPGASMTLEEKIEVALLLQSMRVDVIEAGFPIASDGDFEAVSEISKLVKTSVVAGLARASVLDIERAAAALQHAERPRIHTFISTSPVHIKYKLNKQPHEVLDMISQSVTLARKFTDNVEWSAEDGSRTEVDYLCQCVERAIKAGATTINIPDTVGYAIPDEYADIFTQLRTRVPGAEKVIFSTHCHNDLGMAVANSLASLDAGVRQVECTINGIGERSGNAALEEIVMAIKVRDDRLPYWSNIDNTMLMQASKLVSAVSSFPIQYNKAIVGRNAFAHESGIHQDGILKSSETYEIMKPESVGVKETSLVMGKHSGRHAFRTKLQDLGYGLSDNALEDAFVRFKSLADRKKHIYDEDIAALVDDEIASAHERAKLVSLTSISGTYGPQRAFITITIDGTEHSSEATGIGAVDAIFGAIRKIMSHSARLELYQVSAVTKGTDAQAEVAVKLDDSESGKSVTARSSDPDTLTASAKAYISAVNKLQLKMHRGKPNELSGSQQL